MITPAFPAFWFDGRHTEAVPTQVHPTVEISSSRRPRGLAVTRESLHRVTVSDLLGWAPRMLWLPEGATLEIFDPEGEFDAR